MRIDAHQHFWRLADRGGEWPPADLEAIYRDFEPADLEPLLRRHGIDGTVVVQSLPKLSDNDYMLALAQRDSFIRGIVGWVEMKSNDAPAHIAQLARHAKFKGVRPMLQSLPDDWIADPSLAPAAEAMIEHGLCFDALVLPPQLRPLLGFAQRYPDLPIVIDHAAKPYIRQSLLDPWKDDIAALAALPNVHCKLSGMVTEAAVPCAVENLKPYVDHLIDVFGPDRLIWGSDWPVLDLAADYGRWIDMSAQLVAGLDTDAQRKIFGANAQRFYRLEQ
jgi:L-fuconolactonase